MKPDENECKFCEKSEPMGVFFQDIWSKTTMNIEKGKLRVVREVPDGIIVEMEVTANYCPICGRKLQRSAF